MILAVAFALTGRLSSRCSTDRQMMSSRQSAVADVEWYGCDTMDQGQQRPSSARPYSVAADGQMSPLWYVV